MWCHLYPLSKLSNTPHTVPNLQAHYTMEFLGNKIIDIVNRFSTDGGFFNVIFLWISLFGRRRNNICHTWSPHDQLSYTWHISKYFISLGSFCWFVLGHWLECRCLVPSSFVSPCFTPSCCLACLHGLLYRITMFSDPINFAFECHLYNWNRASPIISMAVRFNSRALGVHCQ